MSEFIDINFNLKNENWKFIKEHGLPEDGTICFVIYKSKKGYQWHFGAYIQENHEFYCNVGYCGWSLSENECIAWIDEADVTVEAVNS